MSKKEKSYEDYFNEFYGGEQVEDTETPDKQEEVEDKVQPEEEVETDDSTQVTDDTDTDKDEVPEDQKSDEQKKNEELDEYEQLLDKVEDEDLKTRIQHLIQSERSQRGRVSALTKKLQKTEEYLNNAAQARQKEPQAPAKAQERKAPASTASDGRKKEEELSPEMAALKEKAPAVYKAMVEAAENAAGKRAEELQKAFEERVRPVEDSYRRQSDQREAERLEKMASELFDTENTNITVRDVITSNDFSVWLRGQPQRVREFYRNATTADEAMFVLKQFENDYQYMKKIDDEIKSYDDSKGKTQKDPSSKGDELKRKRDAAKKNSVSPKSKSGAASVVDNDDYESIFNRFWGDNGVYRTKRNTG